MTHMNNNSLTGRITRDPELRTLPNGESNVNFILAVERDYVGKDGTKGCDWIPCVAFGNKANYIGNYVKKGDKLGVQGKLQSRSYQNQRNETVTVIEVLVEKVETLARVGNAPVTQSEPQQEPVVQHTHKVIEEKINVPEEIADDDLPF